MLLVGRGFCAFTNGLSGLFVLLETWTRFQIGTRQNLGDFENLGNLLHHETLTGRWIAHLPILTLSLGWGCQCVMRVLRGDMSLSYPLYTFLEPYKDVALYEFQIDYAKGYERRPF